jgi:hypothetical protein
MSESIDSLLTDCSDRCSRISTLRAIISHPHSYESLRQCRQQLEIAEKALAVTKSKVDIEKTNLKLAKAYLEALKAQANEIDKLIAVVQASNLGIRNQNFKKVVKSKEDSSKNTTRTTSKERPGFVKTLKTHERA